MQVVRGRQASRREFLSFNLLPPGYRPRVFPIVSLSLGVLAAAAFLLLVAIYQFKATADAEVVRLQTNLQQAQQRLAQISQPAVTAAPQDGIALAGYRTGWSRVLQSVIASLPADVRLQDLAFAADPARGPQVTARGEAAEYAAVVEYADNLRTSPLFSRVTIQSMGQGITVTTPTVTPVGPASAPTASLPAATTVTPTPTNTHVPPTPMLIQPTATPTPRFSLSPTIGTPLPGTQTPAASATPTPVSSNYDFVVLDTEQTCDDNAPANASGDLVSGWVYDMDGQTPMSGIRLRVTSIDASPWSAETTTDGSGYWHFYLTKAKFKVEVLAGISEVANDLYTGNTSQSGVCFYRVTFKKNRAGTPVAAPTTTPTITPTPSVTGTPTPPSPIGTVIAGTASAPYNNADAGKAIDGDSNTAWNSGQPPNPYYSYWEETFDTDQSVVGIQLIVSQSPDGDTTHTVRFYNSSGGEISSLTLSGYTTDGQVLNHPFATPVNGVIRVRVQTSASPSFVAWREIRVYVAGPATATPTATPTITATPTTTATPTPRGQNADAWRLAYPIAINESQVRTFYNLADVDWAKVRTTGAGPYWFKVVGGTGVDTDLELYQYNPTTDAIEFIDSNDDACNPDPLLSKTLPPDTTYYLRIGYSRSSNKTGLTTGSYTLMVKNSLMDCTTTAEALPALQLANRVGFDGLTSAGGGTLNMALATDPPLDLRRGPGLAAPSLFPSGLPSDDLPTAPLQRGVAFIIVADVKVEGGR